MKKTLLYLLISIISLFGNDLHQDDHENIIIRDHYHYSIRGIDKLEAKIDYQMGELILLSNKDNPGELDGIVEYSPHNFDSPDVEYSVFGKKGFLEIKTNTLDKDHEFSFNWDSDHFHNRSEYKLPLSVPIEMELDFGFGETEMDLSGIKIQSIDIECGMGKATLNFESLNPIVCNEINIEAGMGEFEGNGLSYLRAEVVNIQVGFGSADIDFSGTITHDMDIEVEVGLGSVDLVLPDNVNISARVHDNFLSSVDVEDLVKKGNKYMSKNWDRDRPTIVLDMSVGLGSIDLEISH
ncbi:MAG: LiaF domain-containing protein [Fidelibacterota bacterium]